MSTLGMPSIRRPECRIPRRLTTHCQAVFGEGCCCCMLRFRSCCHVALSVFLIHVVRSYSSAVKCVDLVPRLQEGFAGFTSPIFGIEDCLDYAQLKWCAGDGSYGEGWRPEWGSFSNFRHGKDTQESEATGYSARVACCACGGGKLVRAGASEWGLFTEQQSAQTKSQGLERANPMQQPLNSDSRDAQLRMKHSLHDWYETPADRVVPGNRGGNLAASAQYMPGRRNWSGAVQSVSSCGHRGKGAIGAVLATTGDCAGPCCCARTCAKHRDCLGWKFVSSDSSLCVLTSSDEMEYNVAAISGSRRLMIDAVDEPTLSTELRLNFLPSDKPRQDYKPVTPDPEIPMIAFMFGVTTRGMVGTWDETAAQERSPNDAMEKSSIKWADGPSFLAAFRYALPGLVKTASIGFTYVVIIGYDAGDPYWDTAAGIQQVTDEFHRVVVKPLAQRKIECTMQLVRVNNTIGKPGPVFNAIAQVGYDLGATFFYRLNDDTTLTTEWAHQFVGALRNFGPPYGVVGPSHSGGNNMILTHDFVHRTHMEIFGHNYYPPELVDWFMDDWVTHVYGEIRTARIGSAYAKHHEQKMGTRYSVDFGNKKFLLPSLVRGKQSIGDYMLAHEMFGYEFYYQAASNMELDLVHNMQLAENRVATYLRNNENDSITACAKIQREGDIAQFRSWGSVTKMNQMVWETLDCDVLLIEKR